MLEHGAMLLAYAHSFSYLCGSLASEHRVPGYQADDRVAIGIRFPPVHPCTLRLGLPGLLYRHERPVL